MANLRFLKKEIDYRLEEFAFDCHMAIFVINQIINSYGST